MFQQVHVLERATTALELLVLSDARTDLGDDSCDRIVKAAGDHACSLPIHLVIGDFIDRRAQIDMRWFARINFELVGIRDTVIEDCVGSLRFDRGAGRGIADKTSDSGRATL